MTNTRSFDLPIALPEGFVGERLEKGWVAVDAKERATLVEAGFFDPIKISTIGEPTSLGGRGSLRRVKLYSGFALLRPYLHGGLLRFFTGARFLSLQRPFHELEVAENFRACGLATPPPLGVAAFGSGLGYRLYFLSREVPGIDLLGFLEQETDAPRRQRVLADVGVALRRMHDLGWIHADLHPKNLLVEASTGAIYFLDLDRSQRILSLPQRDRVANLARLFRYGQRRRALGDRVPWKEEEFFTLLQGYDPQNPKQLAVEIVERFARESWMHRWGWSLERAFRPRR